MNNRNHPNKLMNHSHVSSVSTRSPWRKSQRPIRSSITLTYLLAGLVLLATSVFSVRLQGAPKFTVNCPHCDEKFVGQIPLTISTNGGRSVAGGTMIDRTLNFMCPNSKCQALIHAKNEKFVKDSIAIEDVLPPMPVAMEQTNAPPLKAKSLAPPASTPKQGTTTMIPLNDMGAPIYMPITWYVDVPFTWRCVNNQGMFQDPLSGDSTSFRMKVTWVSETNHYYSVWYATNNFDDPNSWLKFPMTASCPTNFTETNIVYLPVMQSGMRLYSLRGS